MSDDPCGSRFGLWLGGLWIVALAIRILFLAEIADSPLWLVHLGEARSHDSWARQLAAGNWLGSAVFDRPPLYPHFLGTIYAFIGEEPIIVRFVQALVGATSCVLLAIAGARLVTQRVGLTAGLMLALYPPAIFFDGLLQRAMLTSFLLCGFLAIVAGLTRSPAARPRWAAAGAVAGLLMLTTESALLLLLAAPIGVFLTARKTPTSLETDPANSRRLLAGPSLKWTTAFFAGAILTLLPVATRNAFVSGEWKLTASQFAADFYIGNNAYAEGLYSPLLFDGSESPAKRSAAVMLAEQEVGRPLKPVEVTDFWLRKSYADLAADPLRWVRLLFRKLWIAGGSLEIPDSEDPYTYAQHSRLLSLLVSVWHMGVLLPMAIFGAALVLPRHSWRRRLVWPTIVVMASVAGLVLFYVNGSGRFSLVPPLMLFAAAGLWEAVRIMRRMRLRVIARSLPDAYRAVAVRIHRPFDPAMLVRATWALLLAALVAVPANRLPYSRELVMSITRENLGAQLYQAGFPHNLALEQYDRAIAIVPGNTDLRVNYAAVLWEVGRSEAAREQLELAIEQSPDDAAALVELALLLREFGDFEGSEDRLRSAVVAAPESAAPPYHLAVTLLQLAESASTEAAMYAIDSGPSPQSEGSAFRESLNRASALRAEAKELLRRSIELEESEAAHTVLADLLARLGEVDDAADEYGAAAALAPAGSTRQLQLRHRQLANSRRSTRNPPRR